MDISSDVCVFEIPANLFFHFTTLIYLLMMPWVTSSYFEDDFVNGLDSKNIYFKCLISVVLIVFTVGVRNVNVKEQSRDI